MSEVYIPSEDVTGVIIKHMAYGAIVRYYSGGIEFEEMLAEEDYVVIDDE